MRLIKTLGLKTIESTRNERILISEILDEGNWRVLKSAFWGKLSKIFNKNQNSRGRRYA